MSAASTPTFELKANEQGAARSIELVDALAAALERLDACRQVLVSSFSQPLLMAFHQRHPQYATAVLYKSATIRPDWRSVAELCGAVAIHPEDAGLTEAMVHAARAAGYGVNVWTVNRPTAPTNCSTGAAPGCSAMSTRFSPRPGALNTSLGTGESRPGLLHLDRPTGGL